MESGRKQRASPNHDPQNRTLATGSHPGETNRAAGSGAPPPARVDAIAPLRSLLQKVVDALGAHHGMALVVEQEREMVVCRAVYRLPPQHADTIFFKMGQGNTGKVAASGKPVRLNDPASGKRSALLIIPVLAEGQVVAVLNVNGTASHDGFTAQDEASAMRLAWEAGPRIRDALRAEQSPRPTQDARLSELVSSSVLKEAQDACSQLLGVPCVFVDPHGRCLSSISAGADFCTLMRSRPNSALQCELSMAMAGSRAEDSGACSHECHAGVMTHVTPVFARKEFVGALVVMLRYQARDAATVRALASNLGLDPYETLSKASAFPTAAPEQEPAIRAITDLVCRLVGQVAAERLAVLEEQQRLIRMDQEIDSVRELTRRLIGVLELGPALAEVCGRAVSLTSAVAADITLLTSGSKLQVHTQTGLTPAVMDLLTPAAADSPGARVIAFGKNCFVPDIAAETRFPGWAHALRRQPGIRSALSILLGIPDRPTGALTIYSDGTARPSEDTMRLLAALTDHAALAIQSAQATEQARSNENSLRLFLSRMTRGLSSSIDTDQLIQWVADFASEMSQSAHCVVYEVIDDEIQVRATSKTGRIVIERPRMQIGQGLSGHVASTRRVMQVPDVLHDPRFVTSASSTPPDAVRYVGLPMLYKGELLGVLSVYGTGKAYTEADLQLLSSFAGQAAVAIENARSYEHQREIASIMQQSFLPRERLRIPGLEAGHLYVPASEQVGGDYYDFQRMGPHRASFVLGDVSGKGIRAATFTAMGKYVLRAYAFEDPSPDTVLSRMNNLLATQIEPGTFITLFYGVLDLERMEVSYANAGHPDGLIYCPRSSQFTHLASTGMMVGAVPNETFESRSVGVAPGDVLVLYTDGVVEARRGNDLFGIDRLMATIRENASLPATDLARAIYDQTTRFQGSAMADDTCIIVLRFLGLQEQAGIE